MAKTFIDTNLFVYALDQRDIKKHDIARRWIRDLSASSEAVVSTQVLQEFYSAATRKLGHDPLAIKQVVQRIALNELVVVELTHIETAIDLCVLNQISFWDALLFAAAKSANCAIMLSEDLQAGSTIGGVRVSSPF
ncbi:MAG TPA: PIN domain-containing protein [Acidimicrobiales bacterium]|nr:PIN domain-containing protein [Acidimicrobiales bacterium]